MQHVVYANARHGKDVVCSAAVLVQMLQVSSFFLGNA